MTGKARRNTAPVKWFGFVALCIFAVASAITFGELAPWVVPRRGPSAPAPPPPPVSDPTTPSLPPPLILSAATLRAPFDAALAHLQSALQRSHNILIDDSQLFLDAGEVLSKRWLTPDKQRLVVVRYRIDPTPGEPPAANAPRDPDALTVTVDVMRRDAPGNPWSRATARPLESLSLRVSPEVLDQSVSIQSAGEDVVSIRFPARGACRSGDARLTRMTYLGVNDSPTRLLSLISEGALASDPLDSLHLSLRWITRAGDEGDGEASLQQHIDGLTAHRDPLLPQTLSISPPHRAGFARLALPINAAITLEASDGSARWTARVISVSPDLLTLSSLTSDAPADTLAPPPLDAPPDGASVRVLLPAHTFSFKQRRDGFRLSPDRILQGLDGHPALWSIDEDELGRAERALSATASPAPAALDDLERRYLYLIQGLEWVGDLDAPPPYCVETPQRVSLAEGVDAYAWQNDLAKRLSRLRLALSLLIAHRGDGPRALQTLAQPDPVHALQGSLRGDQLLRSLRGLHPSATNPNSLSTPQLKELRYDFKRPFLRPAPMYAHPALRTQPLPLRWQEEGVLRLSLPASPLQAARALSLILTTRALHPTSDSADRPSSPSPHLAGHVIADATRRAPAIASTRAMLRSTSEETLDFRASGPPQRRTQPTAAAGPEAALLSSPLDVSPLETSLLLDWGLTCDGWTLISCKGIASTCANPTALGLKPDAFQHNLTIAQTHPWLIVQTLPLPSPPPLCTATSRPQPNDSSTLLLGWLDDQRWVLSDQHTLWAVPSPNSPTPLTPLDPADLQSDPSPLRWLYTFGGDQRRFSVHLDRFGLWLWDHKRQRYTLLDWWQGRDISLDPPAPGRGLASLSPRGQWLAVWSEGKGLMVGRVTQLPQ